MQWDDLKFVLAAARSGSFAKAASLLKVSHTTIGRRIKALEVATGSQLFERDRDGCVPTEACFAILPVAERMDGEARNALALASAVQEVPRGLMQLHTGAWIIEKILVPKVPQFLANTPTMRLFLVGDVVEDKSNLPEFAMSLRFDVMAHRSEVEIALARFDYAVYRHRDADPATVPWLTTNGGTITMQTYSWLSERNIELEDVPLIANDAGILRRALLGGVGQALVPTVLCHDDPDLVRVSEGAPELQRTMRALVPRHIASTPQARVVLEWIRAALVDLPGVHPV